MAKGRSSFSGLHVLGFLSLGVLVAAVFFTVIIAQQQTSTRSDAAAGVNKRPNLFAAVSDAVEGTSEAYAIWLNQNPREGDWVGLYLQGADDSAPLEKMLLTECESATRRAKQQIGVCVFPAPTTSGTYEFRMFGTKGNAGQGGENEESRPTRKPTRAPKTRVTATVPPEGTLASGPTTRERRIGTSNPFTITAPSPTVEPTTDPSLTPSVTPSVTP